MIVRATRGYCPPCSKQRKEVHEQTKLDKLPRVASCVGCGVEFEKPQRQRFCSQRCAGKYNRNKQIGTRTKTCVACDSTFTAQDDRKNTCSTACRQWARKYPGRKRPPPMVRQAQQTAQRQLSKHPRHCHTCGTEMDRCAANTAAKPAGHLRAQTGAHPQRLSSFVAAPSIAPTAAMSSAPPRRNSAIAASGAATPDTTRRQATLPMSSGSVAHADDAASPSLQQHRINKQFCCISCQVCFNQEMRRARKRGVFRQSRSVAPRY